MRTEAEIRTKLARATKHQEAMLLEGDMANELRWLVERRTLEWILNDLPEKVNEGP